jgi:hypothetical protein
MSGCKTHLASKSPALTRVLNHLGRSISASRQNHLGRSISAETSRQNHLGRTISAEQSHRTILELGQMCLGTGHVFWPEVSGGAVKY